MFGDILDNFSSIVGELMKKAEFWFAVLILLITGGFFLTVPSGDQLKSAVIYFISLTWWLWLFFILLPILQQAWLAYRQFIFKSEIKYVLLELQMPREVMQGPQAMEQVLRAIHSLRNSPGNFKEQWIDGEVTRPSSLELVSLGGEIHFYVRTRNKQADLVRAAFFSAYPGVEVKEVPDYVEKFPKSLEELDDNKMEIFGTELKLAREPAYPIKTYPFFQSLDEEVKIDPIAALLEILGNIKKTETVAISIIISPADDDWKDKFKDLVDKLKSSEKKSSAANQLQDFSKLLVRTPGETDILKTVETNLSKPAFDTLIRFVFFTPKEGFSDTFARKGLVSVFNQYSMLNLNGFKANKDVETRTMIWYWPHLFPVTRCIARKRRMLRNYRIREFPEETWIGKAVTSGIFNFNFATTYFKMNIEGIATLFHPPVAMVLTSPHMHEVESKRTGPSAGLQIFGDEKEIEKYK